MPRTHDTVCKGAKLNIEIILGRIRLALRGLLALNTSSYQYPNIVLLQQISIGFILSTLIYLETVSQDAVTTVK